MVKCASCFNAEKADAKQNGTKLPNQQIKMEPTDEELEIIERNRLEQLREACAVLENQRQADIAEENDARPAQRDVKRRYDQLVENCSRRPAPGGFFITLWVGS